MKKRLIPVIIAIIYCAASTSAQSEREEVPERPIAAVNNQWSVDFTVPVIDYRETLNGRTFPLDTETGQQYGWQTSFTVQQHWLIPNLYLNGAFRVDQGTITHGESNPAFDGNPTLGNTKDLDFRAGIGIPLGNHLQVTPYVGIGNHFWDRLMPGSGGYLEYYQHNYTGGGAMVQVSPAPRLVLSGYGFVGKTFGSHLSIRDYPTGTICYFYYSNCFTTPSAYDFALGHKPMVMAGGSADIALNSRWHLNVGVDWNHFRYGHSGILWPGIMEPDSTTNTITAKAGIGFGF